MYALKNNVIGRLKYDIAGGDVTLVVEPIAGTPFNLPPAPTDAAAGSPSYGTPYGILTLADRLDVSMAKREDIVYAARAAEAAGAYTYSGLQRGEEGTVAQAWQAGTYVIQQATEAVLALPTRMAVLRAQQALIHEPAGVMVWDGADFRFSSFRVYGVGAGRHFSIDGTFEIAMPADGALVPGFGGAADANVAGGAIPLSDSQTLWYEPNIGGDETSIDENFRLVGVLDVIVPPHWILIAARDPIAGYLRVCNGATLIPWITIGEVGAPAFQNAWVNQGVGWNPASFQKDEGGWVTVRGFLKSGVFDAPAFTLPAGYRPEGREDFATTNPDIAGVYVITNGEVVPYGSDNSWVSLNLRFQATQ